MVDQPTILPANGTPFLRAFEQVTAYEARLSAGIELIYDVKGRRLASWLSFLLYEYGLLELTPYVSSPYLLLDEGRIWQIERDTWAAVTRGLGWVGAPGQIIEAAARRRWWNSFQLYLDSLPPTDDPALEQIDRVTQASKPFRSDFRRGVNGYDAPPLEADRTRLDRTLLDGESGVRLRAGGPKWSFGRTFEVSHTLTEAEGLAIGNWLDPVAEHAYLINLTTLAATIDDEPVPFGDATDFVRASAKWHDDLAGVWHRFDEDEIAATDRGALLEQDAERLSIFTLAINPLEDEDAATVLLVDQPDPFGGTDATRIQFDGDAGRVLYVPAEGLAPNTVYSVSFFARLISVSGTPSGTGGAEFVSFLDQLVADEWVRVKGPAFTTGPLIDGQWFDLTLTAPGVVIVVELFGFQVEAGSKVTSPIEGVEITGERAADALTLILPEGLNNVVAKFDDGTGQSFLSVTPPYDVDPATLNRPVLTEISNLSAATWESMAFPWSDATFPWNSDLETQRAIVLAGWFAENPEAYFALRDAGGALIGYRRARLVRQVNPSFVGPFSFAGAGYEGSEAGTFIFAEAMTDGGNGAGVTAASTALVVLPERAAGVPPGRLWLTPDQLTGGEEIAARPVSIPLRATVRERIKLLLRF